MMTRANRCLNFNHGRANAPVPFCPMCGEVVNEKTPLRKCSAEAHATERRKRNKYCMNCGEQPIT